MEEDLDLNKSKKFEGVKDDFIIINTLSKIASSIIFIFGLYIHFNGDLKPGGGFQSGVIFAGLFLLLKMIDVLRKTNFKTFSFNLKLISFVGFCFYCFGGLFSLIFGKNIFAFPFKIEGLNILLLNIFEIGICLGVFSAFYRIFSTLFSCLKDENVL